MLPSFASNLQSYLKGSSIYPCTKLTDSSATEQLLFREKRSLPEARSCASAAALRRTYFERFGRCKGQRLDLTSKAVRQDLVQHRGKVIIVDNYDSFTYNLSQYLGSLGCDHAVLKNDEVTVKELQELEPKGILLSPGPGRPEDSGISLQVVHELGQKIPLFGVCMGHQCIGQVFGGKIVRAPCGVMHGKTSPVFHKDLGPLKRLSNPFKAARYHSLVIERDSCPDVLEVTAWTEDGTIMAVQHKDLAHIQGVQFHPESIITDNGMSIMNNFLRSL